MFKLNESASRYMTTTKYRLCMKCRSDTQKLYLQPFSITKEN